ncbi:MAG TPA: hypothetical protein PK156_05530 [Polyangium sp.]|nr:hypothetical protein [Polyangium sp.]
MISSAQRSPRAVLSATARALLFSLVAACSNNTSPADPAAQPSAAPTTSSSGLTLPVVVDASVPMDAAVGAEKPNEEGDAGPRDASAAKEVRPFVADNKVLPPLESEDLTERAKKLFEAIVQDDPVLAESFWFPKEPFIPLKDVKGPEKYWKNLHGTYERDIHALHRKRKSWEGATFVGFKIGSTPKWVPPGDEANKIGYYRTFRGKLTYRFEEKNMTIDVHTIISWQGQWFITHLSKFKKR